MSRDADTKIKLLEERIKVLESKGKDVKIPDSSVRLNGRIERIKKFLIDEWSGDTESTRMRNINEI